MVQTFAQIDETLDNLTDMVAQSLAAVNSLSANVNKSQQFPPATYNMATPMPPAEIPVSNLNVDPDLNPPSPFNKPPTSPSVDTPPGMTVPGAQPIGYDPRAARHGWPQQPPPTGAAAAGVPSHGPTPDPWAQYGSAVPPPARQSQYPFAVPQKSVPTVPASMGPQQATGRAGPSTPFAGVHQPMHHLAEGTDRVFSICRKKNESLHVFKSTPEDWKGWKDRVIDHCSRTNRKWRQILEYILTVPGQITFGDMQTMDIEGHPASEMSKIFFDWVCDWLPQRLYNRRLQLAGREFGNGFELFRKLRLKYEGTGTIMDVAGADCLHQSPRCRSEKQLEEHLDAWEEMLDKYGGQLIEYAPGHVRVMLIKTLPSDIENELLDHPDLSSWEQILDYLRRKLIYKHQKHLASYIKPGSTRVHAVRRQDESDSDNDDDEPAPRGRSHTKAVKASSMPSLSDPATIEAVVAAVMRRQGGRDRSTSRDKNKPKFIWKGGCHECGGDHFKRECPKWVKLMKDHGDRMPEGHTNAYSKARDAFNKANGIKPKGAAKPKAKPDRKRVNALVTEEPEESDFSSNDSEASFRTAMKTVRTRVNAVLSQPTPVANAFQALDDHSHDDIVDCLPALNGWAHRVVVKPKKVAKKLRTKKATDVVIHCEDDLDAALREDELLAAKLPGETDHTK